MALVCGLKLSLIFFSFSFPDDLKTEKYKNGRGKSSSGDLERPSAALGHLRTTSHDHSYTFPFSGRQGKNDIELLLMRIRFEFQLALDSSVLLRHL